MKKLQGNIAGNRDISARLEQNQPCWTCPESTRATAKQEQRQTRQAELDILVEYRTQ
jgi:hypothetical protein